MIRVRKRAPEPRGGHRVAVAGLAFVRLRQELLQQPRIAGVVQLHQLRPVFQLRGGDPGEPLHIHRVLRFVLQQGDEEPLACKIIRLLDAVDGAVGRGPAARAVPAEGQIVHPAAEYEVPEDVDGVCRRSVRQLHLIGGGDRIPPDIGAVVALGLPEKRVTARRFKLRLQPLRQKRLRRIGHVQERPQPCQQSVCGLHLRQAAVKGVAVIDLVHAQGQKTSLRSVTGGLLLCGLCFAGAEVLHLLDGSLRRTYLVYITMYILN